MPRAPETGRAEGEALGLLGLARRAGRAVVGRRQLEEAARSGELRALVLAGDATENARERLRGLVGRTEVPTVELADRLRLGSAVGKGAVAAVGVTDRGLAARVLAATRRRDETGAADRRPAAAPGVGGRTLDRTVEEDRR